MQQPRVHKFKLTHQQVDASHSCATMKTFKKLAAKATKRHDEHPHSSQSTAPSHNHDKFSEKALTVLIFSAEAAGRILDDLEVPVLKTAVGGLLAVLKSIKVRLSHMRLHSY